MQFYFSDLITNFQELLGIQKELVVETFNKPDATDIVMNKGISVKNFGDFYFLVIFEMDGQIVRFYNAYRIYPKLLNGADASKMKPLEMLTEFMNRYGIIKEVSRFDQQKIFIDRKLNVFFPEFWI